MALPIKQDLTARGLELLISQWQDNKNVTGLLTSLMETAQPAEDLMFQLLNERDVFSAIGEQLNVIGRLVGEPREGRLDTPYRTAILNRISINNSDGTLPSVVETMTAVSGSNMCKAWEHYPASIYLSVDNASSNELAETLDIVSAAGVSTTLILDEGGNSFVPARSTGEESDLVLENDDNLEVFNGVISADLAIVTDVNIGFESKSFLPHSQTTELTNPLAVTINRGNFEIVRGDLVLENDDMILLGDGSTLSYQLVQEV